ncbi:hypothetical protein IV203_003771 [Nitzschia inconspicua]|uniref:G protein-coupled receptor n=1 Tax=Nitzschia inconspicua TaxID=303405 RepID=A0A9K3PNV9_9STRA|nr:hypothetical protein IV203_003771 [Nitzschia inconspicua]
MEESSNIDETLDEGEELFTRWQQTTLIVIPYITGPISFFSSFIVAYVIVHDWRHKRHHLYHRLLFVMSVCDMIGAVNASFSGLSIPKEYGRFASHGTIASCELAGFLMQLSVSMPLLNMFLCLFYMRVVCFGWKPPVYGNAPTASRGRGQRFVPSHSVRQLGWRQVPWFELSAYLISIVFPLACGGVALYYDSFNPMVTLPGWCYFSEVPYDCNKFDDVQCIRGENYSMIQLFASTLPVGCAVIVGIVAVSMVTRSVRKQCRTMIRRYGISTSFSLDFASQDGMERRVNHEHGSSSGEESRRTGFSFRINRRPSAAPPPSTYVNLGRFYSRLQETAEQARLYTAAFIITYVMPIIQAFTGAFLEANSQHRTFFFITGIIITVFTPLQGLWNLIIYMRPYYRHERQLSPDLPMWRVAVLAVGKSMQVHGSSSSSQPVRLQPRDASAGHQNPRFSVASSSLPFQVRPSGEAKQASSVAAIPVDEATDDDVIDPNEFETFELNLDESNIEPEEASSVNS